MSVVRNKSKKTRKKIAGATTKHGSKVYVEYRLPVIAAILIIHPVWLPLIYLMFK